MNKAKTLKRHSGNPRSFLSVAWDTEDNGLQVSISPMWEDVDWKLVLKNVFKLQKLIHRASSRGEIRNMGKYQKLLTSSYYPRLLAVKWVTQDNQGNKTAGVDGMKNLLLLQRDLTVKSKLTLPI